MLLRGVGTLRYLFTPSASVQWQLDGLTTHSQKWFLGAGFLGAPPISLTCTCTRAMKRLRSQRTLHQRTALFQTRTLQSTVQVAPLAQNGGDPYRPQCTSRSKITIICTVASTRRLDGQYAQFAKTIEQSDICLVRRSRQLSPRSGFSPPSKGHSSISRPGILSSSRDSMYFLALLSSSTQYFSTRDFTPVFLDPGSLALRGSRVSPGPSQSAGTRGTITRK